MAKILKTTDLVNTSIRRASIPAEESAFTKQDIIDIINEEMQSYIMPIILRLHEDFYLYDDVVTIKSNISKYKIPYRATGNKLYDVAYQDNQGNIYEMVKVPAGRRSDYSGHSNKKYKFFIKGDSINLLDTNISASGSLIFSYFLRPNNLVKDDRAATITNIGTDILDATITSYADLLDDTITINGVTFTAVSGAPATTKEFEFSTDNNITATNLANAINTDVDSSALVTALVDGSTVTIRSILDNDLSVSYSTTSNIGMTLGNVKKEITLDQLPTHFPSTTLFDFIQGSSPSTIMGFDKQGTAYKSSSSLVIFDKDDVSEDLAIGDYVMAAQETITAQIPTELQPLLAQKVACKLLEAIGDSDGIKLATSELDRLERNLNTLIDTRVDESIAKVHNRHSSLRTFSGSTSSRGN